MAFKSLSKIKGLNLEDLSTKSIGEKVQIGNKQVCVTKREYPHALCKQCFFDEYDCNGIPCMLEDRPDDNDVIFKPI